MRNNVITAIALLDHGANIDLLDNGGDSALHDSIYFHSDNVTQLLLSRGATYSLWCSTGENVLHSIAKSGGNRTVDIMIAAGLHGIDPDALNRERKSASQLAQERGRTEKGFVEKLHELLEDIRARNATLENSIHKVPTSQISPSWPHRLYVRIYTFFRPKHTNNSPCTNPKIPIRTYCSLYILSCVWIYQYLETGRVASLL